MPIQEENIVFVESQVLDDVPEGGGAATGRVVPDGELNNVFEDISDLDRAYGRFNLRKLFLAVRSLDTSLYGGAKLAVTALPNDPALDYAVFTTKDPFDTRLTAANRVASYLYKGPMWQGVLFGNHIVGMRQIRLLQRVGSALPVIGKTLCLVENEGLPTEKEQYVRVTQVEAVETVFSYMSGNSEVRDYTRLVVTLSLSDSLRFDFRGHDPSVIDAYTYTDKCRVRDTTVADATTYYSSKRTAADAAIGDLRIRAESLFTALVPSAQTETPLVNQVMAGAVSLELDAGGGHTVEVQQSAQTLRRLVTVENRRLNWIEQLKPFPAPGTLSISFMAQGNWYLLRDNGDGTIQGDDPTIGTGTIDYTTSTVAATLGALPDAGSQLIYVWGTPVHYTRRTNSDVTDPVWQHAPAEPIAIEPGSISLKWMAGGVLKTLTDDGAGLLEGPGYGAVDYATGALWFKPALLPDPNTQPLLEFQSRTTHTENFTPEMDGNGFVSMTLANTPIRPGSVSIRWETTRSKTQTEKANNTVGQVGYASTNNELSSSNESSWVRRTYSDGREEVV